MSKPLRRTEPDRLPPPDSAAVESPAGPGAGRERRGLVFAAYLLISALFFAGPLFRGSLIAFGDGLVYYFPVRAFYSHVVRSGFSDWNTYNFLGYSLTATMQAGILYPLNLIYLVTDAITAFNLSLVIHYALAAFFSYLLARSRGNSWPAAFLGGTAFGFAGFLMAHRGHVAMMNTGIWLPLIVYCYERLRQTGKRKYLFLCATALAVQVTAGYFAVVVYTAMVVVLYAFLSEWVRAPVRPFQWRRWLAPAIALLSVSVLALLLAAPQLQATLIHYRHAWRSGFEYYFYTAGSFPPFMLLSFVVPFLFGGAYGVPVIYPWNVVELSGFVGTLPLITAIVAITVLWRSRPDVRIWSWIGLFALMAIFNRFTPVGALLYQLPVYNVFRYHGRFVIAVDLALAMLFAAGVDAVLLRRDVFRQQYRKFMWLAGSLIGVVLCLSTIGESLFQRHLFDERGLSGFVNEDGLAYLKALTLGSPVIYVPLLFLAGLVGVLTGLRYWKTWTAPIAALSLAALVLAELYSFSMFYDTKGPPASIVNPYDTGSLNPSIEAVNRRLKDERYFAVQQVEHYKGAGVQGGLFSMLDRKSSVNGIEPLIHEDVNRLFGFFPNGVSMFPDRLLADNLVLSLAAVKYVILPSGQAGRGGIDRVRKTRTHVHRPEAPPKLTIASWQLVEAGRGPGGEFSLAPRKIDPGPGVGGLVSGRIRIEPNTRYLVGIDARLSAMSTSLPPGIGAALTVDFYGPEYDREEARLRLYSMDLGTEYRRYMAVFETGGATPELVALRAFNTSGYPLQVRNIEVSPIADPALPASAEAAVRIDRNQGRVYEELFDGDGFKVVENLNARPRLFCVDRVVGMMSRDEMLAAILAWRFNPAREALVSQRDQPDIVNAMKSAGCGSLRIRRFESGRVEAAVDFDKAGMVVFSEQWDPRWRAYLDGTPTSLYRANYFAQAAVVKPGSRTLTFVYEPWKGNFSLLGPPLFLLLWCASWWRR